MESEPVRNLYIETEIQLKVEVTKNLNERPESPEVCSRSESPSSNASTSGVCSMASSDFEYSEENPEDKIESPKPPETPLVIIYEKRNILDIFENVYPFSVYQTTNVPKMNMSNYWERRSVYHRLGPFGTIDELGSQKCYYCDFYKTVPKNTHHRRTS